MDNIQNGNKDLILKKLSKRIKIYSWILAAYLTIPSVFVIAVAIMVLFHTKLREDVLFFGTPWTFSITFFLTGLDLLGGLTIVRGFSKKNRVSGVFCVIIMALGFFIFTPWWGLFSIKNYAVISCLLFIGLVISILGLLNIKQYTKISSDVGKAVGLVQITSFIFIIAPMIIFSLLVIFNW